MNQLTREMTAGELKFALQAEQVLNSVPQPEYRQLIVEALMILTMLVENMPDINLEKVINVEQLVQRANQIFLNDQAECGGDAILCCAASRNHNGDENNGEQSIQQPMPLIFVLDDNVLSKPHGSGAQMFTIFNLNNFNNETFSSTDTNDNVVIDTIFQQNSNTTNVNTIGILKPFEVEVKGKSSYMNVGHAQTEYKLDQGATYLQLITGDMTMVDKINFKLIQLIDGNNISVLWQLFQYMLITAAEIMFSVTGLEFSYSQAPKSMKSVIQAAWLLNVTIGNLLVAIIADVKLFPKQVKE